MYNILNAYVYKWQSFAVSFCFQKGKMDSTLCHTPKMLSKMMENCLLYQFFVEENCVRSSTLPKNIKWGKIWLKLYLKA